MQDVGRDDAGMERRAEGIEARKAQLSGDHRLVREGAADATIFFGESRAKKAGRAGLGPHFAVIHAFLGPSIEVGHVFGCDEAPCLLFEQHKILGHPSRTRKADGVHRKSCCALSLHGVAPQCESGWR